jgi:hypothetical protein
MSALLHLFELMGLIFRFQLDLVISLEVQFRFIAAKLELFCFSKVLDWLICAFSFISFLSILQCSILQYTWIYEVTLSGRGIIFSATIFEAWSHMEGEEWAWLLYSLNEMTELMSKPIVCVAKVIDVKLLSSYYTFQLAACAFILKCFSLHMGKSF